MYTVLIMAKRELDCLERFRPLLSSSMERGLLDTCLWIESGNTVDSALPDLGKLVSRKRSWRAVVISTELELDDARYPTHEDNPFDYLGNAGRKGVTVVDGEVIDCEQPLIRLTHLLGGMPSPGTEVEASDVTLEDGGGPTSLAVAYDTADERETEEARRAVRRWNEAHALEFEPPAEIVLVKARRARTADDERRMVASAWRNHRETDSSLFWQRNLYPSSCRFLAFDFDEVGELRRERLLFELWSAVVVLARADVPPSFLQAFRLHRLGVRLDEGALEDLFQRRVRELNAVHGIIRRSIEEDEREAAHYAEEVPRFTYAASVVPVTPDGHSLRYEGGNIPLTRSAVDADFSSWEEYVAVTRAECRRMERETRRSVDQTAAVLRETYPYPAADVARLSPYQREDFENTLSDAYDSIMGAQALLPTERPSLMGELERADAAVREDMATRPVTHDVVALVSVVTALLAACLLPALSAAPPLPVAGLVAGSLALVALVALAVLLAFRSSLRRRVRAYERAFRDLLSRFSSGAQRFSEFYSNMGTHMRGRSYLDALSVMADEKDGSYFVKQRQIRAIEALLECVRTWAAAFRLDVRFEEVSAIDEVDPFSEVDYATLYSFEGEADARVGLNASGVVLRSTLPFVTELDVEREAIYEHE